MKKQAIFSAVSLLAPLFIGSSVMADTNSSNSANTSVAANFTVSSTDSTNPTPPGGNVDPSNPGEKPNPGNTELNPSGRFALSYIPYQFNFGTTEISGNSPISVAATPASGKTFNVGVKNTTHTSAGWTLSASLTGDLATMYSAEITTTTTQANAKLNDGGTLKDLPTSNMITVTPNAKIGATSSTIMTGNKGNVFAGTYDIDLGAINLKIPDASKIPTGNISGNVNWNLVQAP